MACLETARPLQAMCILPDLSKRKYVRLKVKIHVDGRRIDNPFLTFDDTVPDADTGRTELEEYVHHFAAQSGLEHRTYMLQFAARLARDEHVAMIRYQDEITEPEKRLLETEKDEATGFWKQAKFFKATSIEPPVTFRTPLRYCSSHNGEPRRNDPGLDSKR